MRVIRLRLGYATYENSITHNGLNLMLNLTHTKIIETEKDGNKDREALYKLMKCCTYEVKQGKT